MSMTLSRVSNLIDVCLEWVLRIFFRGSYALQPVFVEKAIEKSIVENTKVFKGGVLPPNRLKVLMHEEDYLDFKKIEHIYIRQLNETAANFVKTNLQEQSMALCKPLVSVAVDSSVPKGTVTISAQHDEVAYEERDRG